MQKRGIGLLIVLIGLFLIMPVVSAQTYSGFSRFTDNVKLFFSSGDNKVNLALQIREKEVNSALDNLDGNEIDKNLERARSKLLIVQEKVSVDVADDVKNNVEEIVNKIEEKENLSEEFETYILEEEKTKLTAELVVDVDGKEGQTLTREIVKNETTNQNIVRIVVVGENGEEIITEIQGQIVQIQNQIAERVVKIDMAGQIGKGDLENGVYIAKGEGNGEGTQVKQEIKTGGGEDNIKNEVVEDGDEGCASGTSCDGSSLGDTIDDPDGEPGEGDSCGDGVDCGDGSAESGEEGTNQIDPAVDSNEGDDAGDSGITGAVIGGEKDNFILRFLKRIFGG